MKTIIRSLACAAALLGGGAGLLRAAEPDAPDNGTVLVLDNDRTMEGDIERVGDQYRVRRGGGETWVPGDRVRRLCRDEAAAYDFLRRQTNLEDADERLRLARWCQAHKLREQALAEVAEAVRLRPGHAPTRALLARLQQDARGAGGAASEAATAPAEPAPPPAVDLTADALAQFSTRVQPILVNACAGCHAGPRSGAFKLTRGYDGGATGRRSTRQNLAAVLARVNFDEPQVSPLLTKAVSDHAATGKAPLKGREAPAFQALEGWVKLTVANNPHLHAHPAAAPAASASAPPAPAAPAPFAESPNGDAPATAPRGDPPPAAESVTKPASLPAAPTAVPAPPAQKAPAKDDPLDPDEFNRRAHPERSKPAAGPKP